MRFADSLGARWEPEVRADRLRQTILQGRDFLQNAVNQSPQDSGRDLACRFIDRNDPPHMQCRIPVFILTAEELGFRMHDLQVAAPGIELDLAEQGDPRARREAVGKVSPVEPFAAQDGGLDYRRRRIGKLRFEQSQVAAAEPGNFGGPDFRDHRGQFSRGQLRNRL